MMYVTQRRLRCNIPTRNPSRRERIAAIAATADYNPEEAAVAAAMLARIPEEPLDAIATAIKAEYGKGIEAQFSIGRLLSEARAMFPADIPFGVWFRGQEFPFSQQTAHRLREAAAREAEVRAFIEAVGHSSTSDRDIGLVRAIELMNRAPKPATPEPVSEADAEVHGIANDLTTLVFAAFRKAAREFIAGIGQLPEDELVEGALLIRELASAYNVEKGVRNGRAA